MLSSYLRLGHNPDFRIEHLYACLLCSTSAICPAHFILLYLFNSKCLVRQTGHEAPHSASFNSFLLLPTSYAHIFVSVLLFDTLDIFSSLNLGEQFLQT